MKIEKVNDHQIRCTLTKADLAERELKLSELAYGSDKAKQLFKDMIQQASLKFGFEAEDIPLMIEAIPLNVDCIVLIITKVEDPEELDTRFSKFAPSVVDDSGEEVEDATEILDLFKKIREETAELVAEVDSSIETNEVPTADNTANVSKFFSFKSMYDMIPMAHAVNGLFDGNSRLYKNTKTGKYFLALFLKNGTKESFNKTCNIISEYGKTERLTSESESFFDEHYELIIDNGAIEKIAQI